MDDIMRYLAFIMASVSYGLALANLGISYKVLKPRHLTVRNFIGSGGGFIWVHILCVAVAFQGFVTWGVVEVSQRLGSDITWRAYALFGLCLIMNVGYIIIFRVEMARLRLQKVVKEEL